MTRTQPLTVSQLNSYIKVIFESDENLRNVFVVGEVSNFKKHYPSGHIYFSLKDDRSVIKAIMFAIKTKNMVFDICDGMQIIVQGRISCYEATGQYQIYVENIEPQGVGSIYLSFEQLKLKLFEQGIFDESLKKPLPNYPQKIGVITSRAGAVIHDIEKVLARRYPICEIELYPVEVQGEKSSSQIVQGIRYFNNFSKVDIIIIGRGGGSLEDLWAFNKEEVAKSIYSSIIPIISAVGHETDITICDFASDKRASTPSAAAEMAVPDQENLKIIIKKVKARILNAFKMKLYQSYHKLTLTIVNVKKFSPSSLIDSYKLELLDLRKNMVNNFRTCIEDKNHKYRLLCKSLDMCSHESVLKRGYSIILKNNLYLKSIDSLNKETEVEIIFFDGSVKCFLSNIKKSKFSKKEAIE